MSHEIEYQTVPLGSIGVDNRYQRPLNMLNPSVHNGFNVHLMGTPEVVRRTDGTYWIVDGQHRKFAYEQHLLRRASSNGHTNGEVQQAIAATEMTCKVHLGLSPQQEAELFDGLNDTKVLDVQRQAQGEALRREGSRGLHRAGGHSARLGQHGRRRPRIQPRAPIGQARHQRKHLPGQARG